MKRLVPSLLASESGATAIEYGLIAAGIAVVIITAVDAVGTGLVVVFREVVKGLAP